MIFGAVPEKSVLHFRRICHPSDMGSPYLVELLASSGDVNSRVWMGRPPGSCQIEGFRCEWLRDHRWVFYWQVLFNPESWPIRLLQKHTRGRPAFRVLKIYRERDFNELNFGWFVREVPDSKTVYGTPRMQSVWNRLVEIRRFEAMQKIRTQKGMVDHEEAET